MSNYGQNPYGPQPNPYAQQPPYGAPGQPRPPQPYGAPAPYGAPGQQPYPPPPPYGQPGGQWSPPPTPAKQPEIVHHALVVVTMDTVPGRQIAEVVGDVVGVVARTRELRPDLRGGNPVDGYVTMLTESRQQAVTRMVEMAQSAGADGVVGLKFDCSEITQSLSEVAAYGTAVTFAGTAQPADESARQTQSEPGDDPSFAPRQPSGSTVAESGSEKQWPPSSWPTSS